MSYVFQDVDYGDPEPLAGLSTEVQHISGTHAENTHGILIAAGPDIDPAAQVAAGGVPRGLRGNRRGTL